MENVGRLIYQATTGKTFKYVQKKLSWDENMSVNLKNGYHLHKRSVLGKLMKSKSLFFHLIQNPTYTIFFKKYELKNLLQKVQDQRMCFRRAIS